MGEGGMEGVGSTEWLHSQVSWFLKAFGHSPGPGPVGQGMGGVGLGSSNLGWLPSGLSPACKAGLGFSSSDGWSLFNTPTPLPPVLAHPIHTHTHTQSECAC